MMKDILIFVSKYVALDYNITKQRLILKSLSAHKYLTFIDDALIGDIILHIHVQLACNWV